MASNTPRYAIHYKKVSSGAIKAAMAASQARQHPSTTPKNIHTKTNYAKVSAYTALQTPWGNAARQSFYKHGRRAVSDVAAGQTRLRNTRGQILKDAQGNARGTPLTPKTFALAGAYSLLQMGPGAKARNTFYMQASRDRAKFVQAGTSAVGDKIKGTGMGGAAVHIARREKGSAEHRAGYQWSLVRNSPKGRSAKKTYNKTVSAPYKVRDAAVRGVVRAVKGGL